MKDALAKRPFVEFTVRVVSSVTVLVSLPSPIPETLKVITLGLWSVFCPPFALPPSSTTWNVKLA